MKKVWKWVIGVVIGVVVVALVVGAALVVIPRIGMMRAVRFSQSNVQVPDNGRQPQLPNSGRVPFGNRGGEQPGWQGRMPYGMMPFNGQMGRQGFSEHGGMLRFGGMMPLAGFFGGLFFLGVSLLLVLSIIWMFRVLRKPAVVAVPAAVTHPCKKCSQPVQEGWGYCPNCGKKV
jgi:hypothetical protein